MKKENEYKNTDNNDNYVIFSTRFKNPTTNEWDEGVDIIVHKNDTFYKKLKSESFTYNERPLSCETTVDLSDLTDGFNDPSLRGNVFEKL